MKAAALVCGVAAVVIISTSAFSAAPCKTMTNSARSSTELNGLFDLFGGQGSGNSKESKDEQWEAQQEILRRRRGGEGSRSKYFGEVDSRRKKADDEIFDKINWQQRQYGKGESLLKEFNKRKEAGKVKALEDQYDDDEVGGIPIPMASFGVGGQFGVGGKYDNGGRFDLRLPYVDQGWVDEDDGGDVMAKLGNFFGGGKKKGAKAPKAEGEKSKPKTKGAKSTTELDEVETPSFKWPWEQ